MSQNVINGIKINDTLYDLNLSQMGNQTSINFKTPSGQTVYEMSIGNDGAIQLYDTTYPYTDISNWGPRVETSSGNATANANFPNYWKSETEIGGSYISNQFRINSFYFGGIKTQMDPECAATHNFVELGNALDQDILLNGVYLFYIGAHDSNWKYLELKGKVPAHGTFLIRGAKCSEASGTTVPVDDYDMIWYDSTTGEPIKFDYDGGGLYLALANNEGKIFDGNNGWVLPSELSATNKYDGTNYHKSQGVMGWIGYIDLVGIYNNNISGVTVKIYEGSKEFTTGTSKLKNCICFRQYGLDPGSATVLKSVNKRATSSFWTYCDMTKKTSDKIPYYDDDIKLLLAPKSSKQPKTFGKWHSRFSNKTPNCINITLGKRGTATNGATQDADRCFNWISVGFFDEYVEYKRVGSEIWNTKYSIALSGNHAYTTEYAGDQTVEMFIKQYDRLRWITISGDNVTTHKAIIRGLSAGTYEFRIRRDNDPTYVSETLQFTIKSNDEVNEFNVFHISDQQGFSYEEYTCWRKTAYAMKEAHSDIGIDFLINTGDMSQSGNREFEWIEYYKGKKYFGYGTPEMPVIGNNDLGCSELWRLANGAANSTYPYYHTKINNMTIWLYYCFDLDHTNPCIFEYKSTKTINSMYVGIQAILDDGWTPTDPIKYFVPSLYSFNYGKYHFIMLNSEYATNSQSVALIYNNYDNPEEIKDFVAEFQGNVYYNIFKWLEKDYETYGQSKRNVAVAHEIPFCIVKNGASTGKDYDGNMQTDTNNLIASQRTTTNGSKLNIDFSAYVSTSPTFYEEDKNNIDTKYAGGCCFSEFFGNNNIKLVLGGHKHTLSISLPTKENVSIENGKRKVTPSEPILSKLTIATDKFVVNEPDNGVTYIMGQATGYKLTSNKDVPGKYLLWNYHYWAGPEASKCALSQQHPMYNLLTFKASNTNDRIDIIPYKTQNIYKETAEKITAYNINNNNVATFGVVQITLEGSDGAGLDYTERVTTTRLNSGDPIKYRVRY